MGVRKSYPNHHDLLWFTACYQYWTLGVSILHLNTELIAELSHDTLPTLRTQQHRNNESLHTSPVLNAQVSEPHIRINLTAAVKTRPWLVKRMSRQPMENKDKNVLCRVRFQSERLLNTSSTLIRLDWHMGGLCKNILLRLLWVMHQEWLLFKNLIWGISTSGGVFICCVS